MHRLLRHRVRLAWIVIVAILGAVLPRALPMAETLAMADICGAGHFASSPVGEVAVDDGHGHCPLCRWEPQAWMPPPAELPPARAILPPARPALPERAGPPPRPPFFSAVPRGPPAFS
ncbi:hypothetical protein GPA19_10420 [Azoarcus indigens]|uniref:DUF2946 family protein n=1 Tax=Azoarcus indigens TaxID=29545 RepID=A0A4R6EER4_9RHOO|nr:DUF2946 family protein [Azoarcus indigens]NMG65362.1 hypothetical protein [Azoarcus indigens]TDN56746.1 hypothetical protein C7389_101125 [Azoarcus indigens]